MVAFKICTVFCGIFTGVFGGCGMGLCVGVNHWCTGDAGSVEGTRGKSW